MGVGVRPATVLPGVGEGVGVRTPVPWWSAEIAFWAVAVAAVLVDVVLGRTEDILFCDGAAGAVVAVEAPPPWGSVGKMPDRRKTSPITAAIVLATRNERWT
jgi:hypothetical protein